MISKKFNRKLNNEKKGLMVCSKNLYQKADLIHIKFNKNEDLKQ